MLILNELLNKKLDSKNPQCVYNTVTVILLSVTAAGGCVDVVGLAVVVVDVVEVVEVLVVVVGPSDTYWILNPL